MIPVRNLRFERRDDGVLVITIDRPERLNALSVALKRDFTETIRQIQFDDTVRVIVITGAGRAFCAGDDISGSDPLAEQPSIVPSLPDGPRSPIRTYARVRNHSQPLIRALRELDKLTIAAVNGPAIQSGLSLALACDFRVASDQARFGSATLRYGFLPDEGGHYLLLQHLGLARTIDFLMRNKIVEAQTAHDLGFVSEVVPPEELLDRACALAAELAAGPQVAMRMLKRAIYNVADQGLASALDDIASKSSMSDYHPDAADSRAAFREKRPPRFNQWLEEQ
jgi:2-(1,2-epoxy-1,2-dihydrophenyl)acetyl-CoA isomerase